MNLKDARDAAFTRAQELNAKGAELTEEEITEFEAKVTEVKELDAKLAKVKAADDTFAALDSMATPEETEKAVKSSSTTAVARTPGEHFVKSVGGQLTNARRFHAEAEFDAKAAADTQVTGNPDGTFEPWLTDVDKSIQHNKRERLVIADLMGSGRISGQAITYFVENANPFEGEFGMVAQGGAKPKVHVADPTTVTDLVRKIAAYDKYTDELLEDLSFWVGEINGRLLYELAVKEEDQLLNGDGTGNNLEGLLNRTGLQSEASTGEGDDPDAIFRAITKVSLATNYRADALVINPSDYQNLRLRKDANEQYYGGGFFAGQYNAGGIMQDPPVWGLRTVVTNAVAVGAPVVGNFRQGATVYRKGGVRVESTNSHDDDFTNNLVTTRVEERLALAVRQPAAFVKVDLSTGS